MTNLARRILALPFVADRLASLAQRGPAPQIPAEVSFAELPALTETVAIPTRHGDIPATVYWPAGSDGHAPVYVNFHGGGFIMRHPEQDDPLCRYLAASAGVVVVNVDYDVAPRYRFPVAVEEGYDAVTWAALEGHGWDGSRLCAGGQSAGGALAAGAARLALELGGPDIALQVLHYPPLDLVTPTPYKRTPGKSILSGPMAEIFDATYVPSPEAKRDRLASPAWGTNGDGIKGIAPALVITCEIDPLRCEGVGYAAKLHAAGALREHLDLMGVDHGYNLRGNDRDIVEHTYSIIAKHVQEATVR